MVRLISIAIAALVFCLTAHPSCAFEPAPVAGDAIRVVVIDPGHGGEDTGAKGPGGLQEKDITLSIARMLAEELAARMPARVLLTRTEDVFIPLEERTAFANANRADAFISIHVNAARNRDAVGTETFFLSMDATDEDARRLAAFENSSDEAVVPADAGAADAGDLRDILLDLANTRSHHDSSRLAEVVHMSMLGKAGREGRGVKQAPFAVLVGATMPAVLVEVGFLSNPAEARWLSSRKDQQLAASAIADAIAAFNNFMTKRKGFIEVSGKHVQD